jgi:transcriptional regulator with XRE-family HTH domain
MPSGDLQQLSALLKRERERSGMTVRELAERAGLVLSTVSRLENGLVAEPRPNHLQRLAQALDIEVEELYAEIGYLPTGSLPGLRPYLRAKFGIGDADASQIEGYVQAIRDQATPPKEGHHDPGDDNPKHS